MYIIHLTPLGDCLPGKRASLPTHYGVPGVIGQQKPTLLVHHSDWSYSFIVSELYWSRENDGGNYLARNHTFFGVPWNLVSFRSYGGTLSNSPAGLVGELVFFISV